MERKTKMYTIIDKEIKVREAIKIITNRTPITIVEVIGGKEIDRVLCKDSLSISSLDRTVMWIDVNGENLEIVVI